MGNRDFFSLDKDPIDPGGSSRMDAAGCQTDTGLFTHDASTFSPHTLPPPSPFLHQTRLFTDTEIKLLGRHPLPQPRQLTLACAGSEVKVHGWCFLGSMALCVSSHRPSRPAGQSELRPLLLSTEWKLFLFGFFHDQILH